MSSMAVSAIAAISLLAWCYLLLLHGRFWHSAPELAAQRLETGPAVAIVVPARDEAEVIGPAIGSLLAQDYPGPLRVILVDDDSSDATAAIANGLSGAAERLTVIQGTPRPPGWAGKLWAVHQGVAATHEEWVLLTDADITHDPAHLATLVAHGQAGDLDMVSEMVTLACDTPAERALVPAFVYFFQMLYPFARINDPRSPVAGAAGGTVLLRRRALERIGGIAAIRGALIDDCTLAAKVKPGGPIWLGHSQLARSIRPYPAFADIWRMIARSAYTQLRLSPLLLTASTAGMGIIFLAPPALAVAADGWAGWAGLLAWVGMAVSFQPSLRRYGRSPLWGVALPAIAAFYMAATIGSAINHHRGRGVVWKRRAYTGGEA